MSIFDHAKQFDVQFISNKLQKIYCSDETLIIDYIIVKSIMSKYSHFCVIVNGNNDFASIKSIMLRKLIESGMLDKKSKHSKTNQIKFKNGSRIEFVNYDGYDGVRPQTLFDLIYVRNSAVSLLYYSSYIGNFANSLATTTRIVYNFDM